MPENAVNMHVHTTYSYNAYGYTPAGYAELALEAGLEVAGIVDFDVLDGLNEFRAAGQDQGLKTCVSLESRVFVPEFADRVINSPGEPGIAYHMGIGFTTTDLTATATSFLENMRQRASARNRELVARVNAFMSPVELDYDNDVIPLTPTGNATERHICLAYANKAVAQFDSAESLSTFWREKLGTNDLDLPNGPHIQSFIRSKTMKRGGIGYVQPGSGSFPTMKEMNEFVLAAGAIPCFTWLDGTSPGEQAIEELFDVGIATGGAFLNVIPDRNLQGGTASNLCDVIKLARSLDMPVIAGTEMNSPGTRFVDDFDSPELAPLLPEIHRGSLIAYAHSALQAQAGLGYLSEWATNNFNSIANKNSFYEKIGAGLDPCKESLLSKANSSYQPPRILSLLEETDDE